MTRRKTRSRRSAPAIRLACGLVLVGVAQARASTVTWAVDADGAWTAPSNWSSDPALPGPADDVLIDRPAGPYTVTLSSGTQSINSLVSNEALAVGGATLAVATTAQASAPVTLGGATLSGGTWSAAAPADALALTVDLPSTLRGVTLGGAVSLTTNDSLTIQNGLTLTPGTSVSLRMPLSRPVNFSGAQTLAGTGEILFQTGNPSIGGTSLTIAPNITIRTGPRGGSVNLGSAGLNQGTLSSETDAQTLTVSGTSWSNTGALRATAGGTLTLAGSWSNAGGTLSVSPGSTLNLGGSFTPAGLGTLVTAPDAPAYITGTLKASAADPFTLSASAPNLVLLGGTISGTIDSPDGSPLRVQNTPLRQNRLSAATLNASLSLPAGVSLTAADTTIQQPVTLTGGALTLTGAWNNASSITATAGSTVDLSGAPVALGPISLTDSTLSITSATYTLTAVQAVSMTTSLLRLNNNGVLDLAGGTLTLPSPMSLAFSNGTLKGGTLAGPAGSPLQLNTTVGGKLDGVTLAADVTLAPQSSFTVSNTLTLDHARVSIGAAATLRFFGPAPAYGSPALTGTGSILFDDPTGQPASLVAGNVGPDIAITARSGASVSGNVFPWTNQGTITAEGQGRLNVGSAGFVNAGTLRATDAGVLNIVNASEFTNSGVISCDPGSYLLFSQFTYPKFGNGTVSVGGTLLIGYYAGGPSQSFVRDRLAAGRAGLPGGIVDPGAASDPTRAVGYAYATDLIDFGPSESTYFDDVVVIGRENFILRSTRFGDANLDGQVNADDYALLDRGFAQHLTGWINGDFDYDGAVTSADYLLIDTTLGQAQGFSPGFLSMRESEFGSDYVATLVASVPEPTSLAACGLALLPLSRRRRPQ